MHKLKKLKQVIVIICILIIQSVNGQDVKSKILGRWELIEYLDSNNTKVRAGQYDFIFKPDSTFEIISGTNTVQGYWNIEDSKLIIKGININTNIQQTQIYPIILITEDNLEFISTYNKEYGIIRSRYKRKKINSLLIVLSPDRTPFFLLLIKDLRPVRGQDSEEELLHISSSIVHKLNLYYL